MMTDMTDVKRFEPYRDEGNREGYGQMEMCEGGVWVRATDYDTLAAKLAAAEARIAHLEDHIEGVAKDTHKIMLQYEAALPAVYRFDPRVKALQDKAQAVVDRWHSPLWKGMRHTGESIDELRDALSALEENK